MLDGEAHLHAQLEALGAQTEIEFEIIVVDNGSRDTSRDVVERFCAADPRVRLLTLEEPRGKAHALNVGVESARGDLLVFVDQDDVVHPGYLRALARALREHDLVCASVELASLNPFWAIAALGAQPDPARMKVRINLDPDRFARLPPLAEAWGRVDVPVALGCALGVRRATLRTLGGFATDVGMCDDAELCLQCWFAGIPLRRVDEAVVGYRLRTDLPALFRQRYGYGASWIKLTRRRESMGVRPRGTLRAVRAVACAALALGTPSRTARARAIATLGFVTGQFCETASAIAPGPGQQRVHGASSAAAPLGRMTASPGGSGMRTNS